MSPVETERVLVVPTELLHRLGYFQGFTADIERYLGELLNPSHASYRPRGEMEHDPSFKQLIPYVVFRHVDAHGQESVFQYRRGKGQGEKRLHAKRSIGIGGHICLDDEANERELHPYEEGLQRELREEVVIGSCYSQRLVGLINDDKTDVGKVHLGVVHLFDVETPDVRAGEAEIQDTGFQPVVDLIAHKQDFETWSQICLDSLFCSRPDGKRR
jgi:predicted NUDIX family phosphoesterase